VGIAQANLTRSPLPHIIPDSQVELLLRAFEGYYLRSEPMQLPASGARRSGRISKEIAILLSGGDTDGRQFSETTKTLMLSRHGASVLSRHKLMPEQERFLRSVQANREIEVRVCGQIGKREDGYIYGMAFVDSSVDFWGIEFPSEVLEKTLTRVRLECTSCRQHAALQFDATEIDVYAVNEGVPRFCDRCTTTTLWKLTIGSTPKAPASVVAHKAEAEKDAHGVPKLEGLPLVGVPPLNRRKERRTKVKLTACIRSSGTNNEIVVCEDMSRGGFCFRSSRRYSEEAMIEVAVPYAPGAVAIFVPAQIANVRKLQEGNLYRYGAAYIRSPKK
jgi:hypothetical protein